MTQPVHQQEKGFTLIELLIVIGIIGFLAAAILVAVDPVKRIQDSRDARRYSEANAILNAILNKQVDDRRIFSGLASAPIISDAIDSQVIVADSANIECNTGSSPNFPGCNQSLDNSSGGPQKNCVANLGGRMAGTATSTGTSLTGSSTDFLPEIEVGDTLVSASGGTCVVTAISSDALATCSPAANPAFAGALYNVSKSIVPNYIASIPIDPRGVGAAMCNGNSGTDCTTDGTGILTLGTNNSGYYIHRTTGNRIEIGSCLGEQVTSINVKR